ncbi:ARSB, partial [Symbiodinium pilosum]
MTGLGEKMQHAGYRTHLVGKWDVGMATPLHTPLGKGYDSWLGYFQHANDYWQESMPLASTGNVDICLNKFRDFSIYNRTYRAGVTEAVASEFGCNANVKHVQKTGIKPQVNATGCNKDDPDYCLPDGCFEEAMFNQYALKIIREHDRHQPLFLFYSFHLLHTPLQIPESYLYMDTMVGNLIAALKERQMYQDTLIVFTADNGGPVYEPGSANNWPLKGGKYSDWEGGVRTNAFVSGGFVPWARRGTKFSGVISIADWYATLATIVGVPVHDEKAEEANKYLVQNGLPLLPPVDGRPQWENIVWDINGRRDALHLSQEALLWWPFKLVTGQQPYSFHQGPVYPNCTTEEGLHADEGPIFSDMHVFGEPIYPSANATQQDQLTMASDCGYGGCLFNVERDPEELEDLAADPVYSDLLFQMQKKLYYLNEGNFNPNRGEPAVGACLQAADLGGFYGPFLEVDDFYKGVHLTE